VALFDDSRASTFLLTDFDLHALLLLFSLPPLLLLHQCLS